MSVTSVHLWGLDDTAANFGSQNPIANTVKSSSLSFATKMKSVTCVSTNMIFRLQAANTKTSLVSDC